MTRTKTARRPVWLKAELEEVPRDLSDQEWRRWCLKRKMQPLTQPPDQGQGAWISPVLNYLGQADFLVYVSGRLVDVITQYQADTMTTPVQESLQEPLGPDQT